MPRSSTKRRTRSTELPSTIARSEPHARHIWQQTHDRAVDTYGDGERAHRVAFASLKHSYKKVGDRWVRKPRKGPSDAQAARGVRPPRQGVKRRRA